MNSTTMSVVRSRLAVLGHHIQTMALRETVLFPHVISGYTIQVDVRHDERIVDFVTEAMSPNEKRNVYLQQKRLMREMYPEYMITERHT